MAVVTRTQSKTRYGWDVKVVTVGADDYVAVFSNVGLRITVDTDEGRAVGDVWKYPFAKVKSWELVFDKVVEDTAPLMLLCSKVGANEGSCQAAVALTNSGNTLAGRTSPTTGISYTGTGLITTASHDMPDGPQKEGVTIQGQGPLVAAVVA